MSMNFNGSPLASRITGISSAEDKKNQEEMQQSMQTAFNRFRSARNPVVGKASQAREFERKVELDKESILAQKICKLSISKGAKEYSLEEYQNLHEHFLELGDIYVGKKAYQKAVALYNMSLRLAVEKLKLPSRVVTNIEWKIMDAEQQFLSDVLKEKAPVLNHVTHQAQIKSYKAHLEQFREAIRQDLKKAYEEILKVKNEKGIEEAEKKKVELVRAIFKNIAVEIKKFIQLLLKDCFDILGKPPCGYAIVGLGSLAREEATPYSDFEFAILISEEGKGGKNKEYFRHLTDLLHLKVINLGETIIPSMAIESLNPTHGRSTDFFFDDITPRGFAFDGAMPQACKTPHGKKDADGKIIFELIQTSDKMAAYHDKTPDGRYWFEVDPHLTPALANVVFLDGDENGKALVKNYQEKMWEVLNQTLDPKYAKEFGEKQYSLGQYIALRLMKENSRDFDPYLNKSGDEGRLFDAKKDLYRIPNLILDALSLFYNLKHFGDSCDKLEKISAHGVLKTEAIEKLKWVLMVTIRFRLDTYLHYKAQKEQINPLLNYFMIKTANLPSKGLKHNLDKQFAMGNSDFESLNEIYQVLIPLQNAMFEFMRGNDRGLKELRFNEINFFIQGQVFIRLLQYSKAIESFQKALEENLKLYGPEHPLVAACYNNLGEAWQNLGDASMAVAFYGKALVTQITLYGSENPYVATSYNNLGEAWLALGKASMAVEFYGKALAIQIKLYGQENPDVATCYNNLGETWRALGDAKKSVVYHDKALAIRIKLYDSEHPLVATSYNNLGEAWRALGDAKKSVVYHDKALAIRIKRYGTEHPLVAGSYNNLGGAWQDLGKLKKALKFYKKALITLFKFYGSEHPNVATTYNNLGLIYQDLKNPKKAIEYYDKALMLLTKRYGSEHPDVATSYNNLGGAWLTLGNASKAVEYHGKALSIDIKLYSLEHPNIARSYNNLGGAWKDLGDLKKAVEFYDKALMILTKLYGSEHPNVAMIYNNLGMACEDLGDFTKAVEYYDKALTSLSKIYDSSHPNFKMTYSNRLAALHLLQRQIKNQKETQLNNDNLVIPMPEASKDYIRRLQVLLSKSIVQVDRDERTVCFPLCWLRQLGDGAIRELSRELQDNKLLVIKGEKECQPSLMM